MDPEKIHDYEIEDEFITVYTSNKMKAQKKRKRSFKKKNKLIRSLLKYRNGVCLGPYLNDYDEPRYIMWCSGKRTRFYKKVAARKFRYNKELEYPRDRSYYRKIFDYKWTVD